MAGLIITIIVILGVLVGGAIYTAIRIANSLDVDIDEEDLD